MHKLYNFIFIDIDGCFNKQFSKERNYTQEERFGLCQELVSNLKTVLNSVQNCKLVISSSWRNFRTNNSISSTKNWRDVLCDMLQVPYDTIYGDIPTANEFTVSGAEARVKDIRLFLEEHKTEVKNYVVIDDECSAIKKVFPNNYVDCECMTYNGFTTAKAKETIWILTNFGKDKKMNENVFVIGDCHFWHSNIIRYCNRPWWKKDENGIDVPDVEKMNKDMIKIWNSVITSDNQTVYVNGDFCFGNKNKVKEIFDQLNGRKRIVLGNHDKCKFKDYYEIGFDRVYDKPIIVGNFCILSHEPLQWVKDGDVYMNIYAHVHTQEMYKDFTSNSFCTSSERLNYKPIRFIEIFEKCKNYK